MDDIILALSKSFFWVALASFVTCKVLAVSIDWEDYDGHISAADLVYKKTGWLRQYSNYYRWEDEKKFYERMRMMEEKHFSKGNEITLPKESYFDTDEQSLSLSGNTISIYGPAVIDLSEIVRRENEASDTIATIELLPIDTQYFTLRNDTLFSETGKFIYLGEGQPERTDTLNIK